MLYLQRTLGKELAGALGEYPVATVLGPRQSGKTTFVRHKYPQFNYANLEDPETRRLAVEDPKAFFSRYRRPFTIDEVQRVPKLLSYIQTMVGQEPGNGQFILAGGHQLALGTTTVFWPCPNGWGCPLP